MDGADPDCRRLPIGAEVWPHGGVRFRVWAPRASRVEVLLETGPSDTPKAPSRAAALASDGAGYLAARIAEAGAGTRYWYRLDGGDHLYPDPASRFQPDGPHGCSQVVDPGTYRWTDDGWPGVRLEGQVLYEMHVGTFTREGTWDAASRELPELARAGITVVEVMPVADFAGSFGWGYDGVNLFAPTRLYGSPDGFRRFVDRAHAAGLGVILDIVYNHLGPEGNYLRQFSDHYFTDRHTTDWGEAINFDGEESGPVREFFIANAGYWIEEFHLDGLRLDATQDIYDDSPEHILAAIARRVREAARERPTILVAENESQHVRLVRPLASGGCGLDAIWNDDFHHSAMVAMTGHNEAYYTDHLGTPQEFISAIKWGFLYQGQRYSWQNRRRGTPTFGLKPATFVIFIQNHDQVANSLRRGKAVEINALWYNALRLLEDWVREAHGSEAAAPLGLHAESARTSFNERFWYAEGEYLYDVVDGEQGDDPACRPNQLFALSLRHPILDPARWERVLAVARERLLTPVGLHTLAPGHPDYKPTYDGDLRARDAAYHQGTVWPWLIGPFVDAWLKVHPHDRAGARRFLEGFVPHLDHACVGSISEIFDAQAPFTPRGCIAQGWSVAEVLRAWVKTTGGDAGAGARNH